MTSPLHTITDTEWSVTSSADIAEKLGLTLGTVNNFRLANRKPKGPRSPGSGRPPRVDLSLIDWAKTNNDNAERCECSPSYIALLRRAKQKQEDFA